MKQCTTLKAKSNFLLKKDKGRPVNVKTGDLFIVTSPEHNNIETALIDRKKTARLNIGYLMSIQDINTYFVDIK